VQAMAFSKMTKKMSVKRLGFSQNLSEISYLFGDNCQSLILNFLTSIRRVINTYKATKMLKKLLISYTQNGKNYNDREISEVSSTFKTSV
jgi:hypothetical protein